MTSKTSEPKSGELIETCVVCDHPLSPQDPNVRTNDGWAHFACRKEALGGVRWIKGFVAPVRRAINDRQGLRRLPQASGKGWD